MSSPSSFNMIQSINPAVRTIVTNALLEDLGQGDATTDNLPQLANIQLCAKIVTRQACVLSGLEVAALCFEGVDNSLRFTPAACNGDKLSPGSLIGSVEGSMASILKGERTALNFLQHLSGIATETRRYADALAGTPSKITNTRKTTPGLRILEQQGVKHGGGSPHRYNLGSCVMLKDNHLKALSPGQDGDEALRQAMLALQERLSHTMKVEIEVDRLDQLDLALSVGADIILLDNMSPDEIRQAIALVKGRAVLEASGGISLETVRSYGDTGVPYISTSKITLGVAAIDIGLDLED
jgi:nicotinate-nucleotide pyrophosphorylase (carboxylating)